MRTVMLGKNGPAVGRLGYGAMVLEGFYGPVEEAEALKTIHRALDEGMTMLDTADAYGSGHNERLVGRAIERQRSSAFIATKFGIVHDDSDTGTELPTGWGFSLRINGRPEYVKKCLDQSLTRLGVDEIDLWYLHYPDPDVPIEETVGAMADAVTAGKVRYLGLSNVTADETRRAHHVHSISAVQYEYSLWRREAETLLLPTLRELGIALVAWAPLGSGFLTGAVDTLSQDDFRQNNPRYQGDNLIINRDRFAPLLEIASARSITPAQLALAWLCHHGDVIPIPGTRRPERVAENARAASLRLDRDTLQRINQIAAPGTAVGATLL